jgi:nitrite reductase/ring-hydroxylating ferredoxin subunit
VPVIAPEDFPKGVRKEVRVDGVDVLLFWYRNEIFAIEARSPAEGAYSEGFISSKLNQEYCIECPGTGSTFDFRTGEIKEWYPSNPVLRVLTPKGTCRNLETYPVRLEQDAILIDVSNSAVFGRKDEQTRGGANTSLENNNVYSVEPKVYVESEAEQADKGPVDAGVIATNVVAITGFVGLAVAGTATAKYWQTDIGLYAFWAAYIVGGGAFLAGKFRK